MAEGVAVNDEIKGPGPDAVAEVVAATGDATGADPTVIVTDRVALPDALVAVSVYVLVTPGST